MTKSTKQKKAQKKQLDLPGKKGTLKNSGERLILKLPVSKKIPELDYWKKILEKGAIRNAQMYYNTSKFVPPVGNPYSWDVEKESVFDEDFTDPFGIGFDPKDMSFLPEIPK